jgi:protein translocase SecG subunit
LIYLLYALFLLSCVLLIATVLLQPGKSDAGALFTSSVSSTAFGTRGTQTILSKITIGAAAGFMLTAFLLSQPGITGNRSVLDSSLPQVENPAPLTNANTAVTPDANTNQTVVDANVAAPNANAANVAVVTTNSPTSNTAVNASPAR